MGQSAVDRVAEKRETVMPDMIVTEDGHAIYSPGGAVLQPGMQACIHLLELEARICDDAAANEVTEGGASQAYREQSQAYRNSVELIKEQAKRLDIFL